MAHTESGVTQWLRWLIFVSATESISVAIAESTNLQTELTIMQVHFNHCSARSLQVGQYSLSIYSL